MSLAETIYQRSLKLPDAAAQEVLDFIEFLHQRYGLAEATCATKGDAAAYDDWFRAQVQQAMDDPRSGITADAARKHFAARRDALWQQVQTKR